MLTELPSMRTEVPGPSSRAQNARLEARECPAFAKRRADRSALSGDEMGGIVLARGSGANLWDVDDNRYVDLAAGFGSVLLGHAAPAITTAITEQAARLSQGLGDLYASDVKIALVEKLTTFHPSSDARVLLCQSGADAVTAALKTAMLATGRPGVLAFEGAYHGLGYAPLAACGFKKSFRDAFASQLNKHVSFIRYPRSNEESAASLESATLAFAKGSVGAVLVEPVLGRGGLSLPPNGFLTDLASLAHDHGALVIADEIWTGLGRSGAMSLMREASVPFDILCLGKGLGGSLSISACLASDTVMQAWANGGEVIHTSTHAGAPLACNAALALIRELETNDLPERAKTVGARFLATLRKALDGQSQVIDIRGVGLMIGVELVSGDLGLRAMKRLLERGFIATSGGLAHEVVIFTPPLIIGENQLDAAASALRDALDGTEGAS